MYDDGDDLEFLQREDRVANEKLERVGGVFVEPNQTEVDCNSEPGACAPDDYPLDPYGVDNRTGTQDDTGYSYGLLSPDSNSISFVPEGGTRQAGPRAPDLEPETELGEADEQDLWDRMEPFVREDEVAGLQLPRGMGQEEGKRVAAAMGDDASDETVDGISGSSATGAPTSDEGDFAERDESENDT